MIKKLVLTFIFCVICSPVYAAEVVRFVNTANGSSGDGTTNETDSSPDSAYITLFAWEAAEETDLGAAGDSHLVHCEGAGTDTMAVAIDGWTQDSETNTITIQVDSGVRHDGKWDLSAYKLAADKPIEIRESFVTLKGLQIDFDGASTFASGINFVSLPVAGGVINIDSCILRQSSAAASNRGIYPGSAAITVATTVNIINTLVYDWTLAGLRVNDTDYTVNILNSTFYNNATNGIQQSNGTLNVKNTANFGNATNDWSGTIAHTTNADDDGASTQTLDSTSGYANEFTDVSTRDFSLVSGGVCEENGTDLSGSGVTEDNIGTSRPQQTNFDISANELIPPAPSAFIPSNKWN